MECTITFCDLCNIDQDVEKFQPLPGQENEAEPLGFFRGVFRGTFEQAVYQNSDPEASQWTEEDFGHRCSTCGDEVRARELAYANEEEFTGFVPAPIPAIPEKPAPKKRGRPFKVKK